jgi:hypothetical protein
MTRRQVIFYNTINLLSLVLFLVGLGLALAAAVARLEEVAGELMARGGIWMMGLAIVLRIVWGFGLRKQRRKARKQRRLGKG